MSNDVNDPSAWKKVRGKDVPANVRASCPAIGRKAWYAGPDGFYACEGAHEQGTDLWVRHPMGPDAPPFNPDGWHATTELFEGDYPRPWREQTKLKTNL